MCSTAGAQAPRLHQAGTYWPVACWSGAALLWLACASHSLGRGTARKLLPAGPPTILCLPTQAPGVSRRAPASEEEVGAGRTPTGRSCLQPSWELGCVGARVPRPLLQDPSWSPNPQPPHTKPPLLSHQTTIRCHDDTGSRQAGALSPPTPFSWALGSQQAAGGSYRPQGPMPPAPVAPASLPKGEAEPPPLPTPPPIRCQPARQGLSCAECGW